MAVVTEPPGEKLMSRPPVQKTEPLITKAMRRNIIAQVVYQVVIFVIVQFKGQVIYIWHGPETQESYDVQ